ncbi:hypothetical protein NQ314_003349 [Rhamnusium bicolor]|uniref:TRUD domain-containing protein n=1 Tax=Rhamnusium bicolor TaxID=1586634 RepID=A0AAV8ZPY2_9CUCU|nr:hypothetical protein NQ314_003349 [Rhamnusium bicolor]
MYSRRGKYNKKNKHFHKGSKFQNRTFHRKKEYRHQDQLTEVEVGITEFVSNLEGFSGIIKARYSDFHVNEINLDGSVAKLTNIRVPKDFISKVEKFDYKEVIISPLDLLPQEKWDAIKNLLNSENDDKVNLEADNLSKEDRIKIHDCIKSHFGQKVVASTVMVEEKKYMQFKKFNKADLDRMKKGIFVFSGQRTKENMYIFLVYKEALDTMDACLKISDCLRMSPANFTYAGVKDKRAKTTQWFCVRKVEPWKLLNRTKLLRNVKIGNFSFNDVPLKLGQLQGNKFRIALRNVTGSDELINQAMNQIKENGFINFYGLQRFGNDKEVPTFQIGVNLLLGKWKEAAQLILKPKTSDDPFEDVSKAKKIYSETGDAGKAYGVLEKK